MDGSFGELIPADIEKTGLHAMRRVWDLGFREITSAPKPINFPDDLRGFKIRVPPSSISLSIVLGRFQERSTTTSSTRRCRPKCSRGKKTLQAAWRGITCTRYDTAGRPLSAFPAQDYHRRDYQEGAGEITELQRGAST
jgi:Bacterial extracellular solute-binding protein, family 7